ncbi:MAG TPA: outer membrane beta-barrel protein [Steroidobacteraceae bacterium]|nr:outer membrane beta-barrel protein [Steroidobacteraceae bacterium]
MNRSLTMAAAAAVLAGLGISVADAADYTPYIGPYIGGGILQSRFDSHHFSVNDVDNEDTSWKADAGIRFTPNFALEAAYTRFGRATAGSAAAGGPYYARANGYSAFAVGLLPLGRFDLFAKAGAARITSSGNTGGGYSSDHATKLAYGAGAQLGNGRVGLRAEYERFDTNTIGVLNVISLGVSFNFGAAP